MDKFDQQRRKRNKSSAHKNNKFGPDPCKSDEDIVNESIHLFYIDIYKLLINPDTTRRHKRMLKTGGNPPRPLNAFMLYRKNQMASPQFENKSTEDKKATLLSDQIADSWNKEADDVKKVFYALQRMAKKNHAQIYKNYKYIRNLRNKPQIQKTENYKSSSTSSRSSSTEIFSEPLPNNPPIPQIDASQPSTTNFVSSNLKPNEIITPYQHNSQSSTDFISTSRLEDGLTLSYLQNNFSVNDESTDPFGNGFIYNDIQDYVIIYDTLNQPYLYNIKTGHYFLINFNDFSNTTEEMDGLTQKAYNDFELAKTHQQMNNFEMMYQQPSNGFELTVSHQQPSNDFELATAHRLLSNNFELETAQHQPSNDFELTTAHQQPYNDFELTIVNQQNCNDYELANNFQRIYDFPSGLNLPQQMLSNILFGQIPSEQDDYSSGCSYKKST
ncbi:hypothetical protein RclHR1_10460003 [Rhizophagus clarus]|uniref:Mating type protein MAT1-1-3 n=1 Tax=Rhizophagus clarus TaxID=94130 RepID=A0A2Z6QDK2_9GLOM|nr:hypothetical protein RclHR1_10460003 [Rhizophagus clarus]GES78619.1 mating type protein MAT1-1-3 [Rhizophagus clarus]